MLLRQATDADFGAVLRVHESAFGGEQGPEIVDLVTGLLGDETAQPLLSLVADSDGRIVGHVLFTAVRHQFQERAVSARILAPLAVVREHQGKGVGAALLKEALRRLAASGVDLVFVLGHPGYYPRFGFTPAGAQGFEAPYPIPAEHADAWMVQALRPNILGHVCGKVRCAETLRDPRHWAE